jgi:hypothetical protein
MCVFYVTNHAIRTSLQEFSLFPTNISYKNWICGAPVPFSEQLSGAQLSMHISYEQFGRKCVLTVECVGILGTVPTNLFVGNILFLNKKENRNGHMGARFKEHFLQIYW